MKNRFEIRGEITAIFLSRSDGPEAEAIIGTPDLSRAAAIEGTWCLHRNKSRPTPRCYVTSHVPWSDSGRGVNRTASLHRLLTNAPRGTQVDHINGNTLDNRRENLRVTTQSQNLLNRGAEYDSRSKIRGVYFQPSRKKWMARIQVNRKSHYLGRFSDAKDAESAVLRFLSDHKLLPATSPFLQRSAV